MRNLVFSTLLVLTTTLFSCDEEKDLREKGYSFFCWPSKTACQNREYGVEISTSKIVIEMVNGQLQAKEVRVATLVCCSDLERLIDTLIKYHDELIQARQAMRNFQKECMINEDIRVNASYDMPLMGKSIWWFSFTDINNPFGFTLFLPIEEGFQAFINELREKYKECCERRQ